MVPEALVPKIFCLFCSSGTDGTFAQVEVARPTPIRREVRLLQSFLTEITTVQREVDFVVEGVGMQVPNDYTLFFSEVVNVIPHQEEF